MKAEDRPTSECGSRMDGWIEPRGKGARRVEALGDSDRDRFWAASQGLRAVAKF